MQMSRGNLTTTIPACRIYMHHSRCFNGYYPDNLSALVPDILPELPLDEFTGGNFIYRKQGKGFIVYSLGPNEKDDNGISYEENNRIQNEKLKDGDYKTKTDYTTYDIVWKCKE